MKKPKRPLSAEDAPEEHARRLFLRSVRIECTGCARYPGRSRRSGRITLLAQRIVNISGFARHGNIGAICTCKVVLDIVMRAKTLRPFLGPARYGNVVLACGIGTHVDSGGSGSTSTPRQTRSVFSAARRVEPEPRNGSTTVSPQLVRSRSASSRKQIDRGDLRDLGVWSSEQMPRPR